MLDTQLAIMIENMTMTELVDLDAEITKAINSRRDEGRTSLMAEFEARATALGLTRAQLYGASNAVQPKKARTVPAEIHGVRFRSPAGLTWTGRGRKPNWLTTAEATGENVEAFRVAA